MDEERALEEEQARMQARMDDVTERARRLGCKVLDLACEFESMRDAACGFLCEHWGYDPRIEAECCPGGQVAEDVYFDADSMAETLNVLHRMFSALI